jgi:recombination associated protein RdgC
MWFRNLQLYSIASSWTPAAAEFEAAMSRHPLLPCGAAAMQSQGWVAPAPDGAQLAFNQGRQLMVALGIEQKLLPASVINQAAKNKAAELEKQQGFPLGRKQLRDLKDRIADELRPRAFVRRRTIRAWIDLEHHRFIVDATTPKLAEDLATVLRADFGEFPITPLDTAQSPSAAMTRWLAGNRAPANFALQDDCELIADNAEKSIVRYVRHGLDGPELKTLIGGGKTATRLGLLWRERVSLVLTDKLALKRVKHLAMNADEDGENNRGGKKNDVDAFDADFMLMTGELGSLLADVTAALGGAKKD